MVLTGLTSIFISNNSNVIRELQQYLQMVLQSIALHEVVLLFELLLLLLVPGLLVFEVVGLGLVFLGGVGVLVLVESPALGELLVEAVAAVDPPLAQLLGLLSRVAALLDDLEELRLGELLVVVDLLALTLACPELLDELVRVLGLGPHPFGHLPVLGQSVVNICRVNVNHWDTSLGMVSLHVLVDLCQSSVSALNDVPILVNLIEEFVFFG